MKINKILITIISILFLYSCADYKINRTDKDIEKKYYSSHGFALIYNENLSVSPDTTHISLNKVSKNLNSKKIINQIKTINNFYKKYLKFKPKIAICGINPHCETNAKISEEEKIITPVIKKLKYISIDIKGPFPADTIFTQNNRKKFNVIIGMYHDQVLSPIKALYNFDAINITLGLPFLRLSPDHGPNYKMFGLNRSKPNSLIQALSFLDKYVAKA